MKIDPSTPGETDPIERRVEIKCKMGHAYTCDGLCSLWGCRYHFDHWRDLHAKPASAPIHPSSNEIHPLP